MKKTTSRIYILSLLLVSGLVLLNSCSGLFGGKMKKDSHNGTVGNRKTYYLSATSTSTPSSNSFAARTVWPSVPETNTRYAPRIEDFVNFKLTASSPIIGAVEWENYSDFRRASIILDPTRSCNLHLSATYCDGEWAADVTVNANSPETSLLFHLKPVGKGVINLGIILDSTLKEQCKSLELWISTSRNINQSSTPARTVSPDDFTDDFFFTEEKDPGKYWVLYRITDTYDATTIIGPEEVYVYPGVESNYKPFISLLNRKHTVRFSSTSEYETTIEGALTNPTKWKKEPSNIYESITLPGEDDFIAPPGYVLTGWKTSGSLGSTYDAGSIISGGELTDSEVIFTPEFEAEGVYTPKSVKFFSNKPELFNQYPTNVSTEEDPAVITLDTDLTYDDFITIKNNLDLWSHTPGYGVTLNYADFTDISGYTPGNKDAENTWLRSVIFSEEDDFQVIPDFAFTNCKSLGIAIPDSITKIGTGALYEVYSADFPEEYGWTEINNNYPFNHYESAGNTDFKPSEAPDSMYFRDIPLSAFNPENSGARLRIKQLYDLARELATDILPLWIQAESGETMVTFSSETTAFNAVMTQVAAECNNTALHFELHLEQLELADDKTIPSGCFNGTSSTKNNWLKCVTLPGTQTIDYQAFQYCNGLTTVSLIDPTALTSIGTNAFEYCENLSTFNSDTSGTFKLPENVSTIGTYPFTYAAFITADLSQASSLTTIPALLFYGNKKLTTFILPRTVTEIGNYVFHHCQSLTTVDLREYKNLTTLGAGVFSDCVNLESIYFPDSITTFKSAGRNYDTENGLLYGTKKLTSVELPPNVTGIPCNAFNSSAITALELPATVTEIDGNAFKDSEITTVTFKNSDSIPSNREISLDAEALAGASKLSTIEFVDVPDTTAITVKVTGNISNWETELNRLKLITTSAAQGIALDLSEATDESENKEIPDEFMKGVTWLSSFKMPQGTITIGKQAFFGVDDNNNKYGTFKEFGFNSTITKIGEEAFMASYLNGTLTLPPTITTIGDRAFCRTMTLAVTFENSRDWQLEVIPDYCFFRSGNDDELPLFIPASVSKIGKNAFVGCISNNRTIVLGDTESDWNEIYTAEDQVQKTTPISNEVLITNIRLAKKDNGSANSDNDHAVLWNDVNTSSNGKGVDATNIKSYSWEKAQSTGLIFELADFTYSNSRDIYDDTAREYVNKPIEYPYTGNFREKSGTWTVDRNANLLKLNAEETLTADDIKTILQEIMYIIGPASTNSNGFNPYYAEEGSDDEKHPSNSVNYVFAEDLPDTYEPGTTVYNTLSQTHQYEIDYYNISNPLFKAVTYRINLGTCILDGEETPVVLTEDYHQNSCIPYQFGWTVYGKADTSVVYCRGYEGTSFPADDLQADYGPLKHTNAVSIMSTCSFDYPAEMIAGEGTIYWIGSNAIFDDTDLRSAASTGGTYTLAADIEVYEPILITSSLTLTSAAGHTYTIIKAEEGWTIPEEDWDYSPGINPLFYSEEENSDIDLTMENIILDGGYISEYEGIKCSDSGLLDFRGNEITLTNVTFQNNWKEWNWPNFSGLNLKCAAATLTNCTFKNLHISGLGARGPGISISKGEVTITDCLFENNTVDNDNDDYQYGRDIWIDGYYTGDGVTVTGTTAHSDPDSYLDIGTHYTDKLTLGSDTGKITVTELNDDIKIDSLNYYQGNLQVNLE